MFVDVLVCLVFKEQLFTATKTIIPCYLTRCQHKYYYIFMLCSLTKQLFNNNTVGVLMQYKVFIFFSIKRESKD